MILVKSFWARSTSSGKKAMETMRYSKPLSDNGAGFTKLIETVLTKTAHHNWRAILEIHS
jgi:hypothetical protein